MLPRKLLRTTWFPDSTYDSSVRSRFPIFTITMHSVAFNEQFIKIVSVLHYWNKNIGEHGSIHVLLIMRLVVSSTVFVPSLNIRNRKRVLSPRVTASLFA